MNVKEDYVNFEIAKLLKEKGFDERTMYHYTNGDTLQRDIVYNQYKNSEMGNAYSAPTLQMAMKWLRDIHNLFIEIQCYGCEYDEKAHFEYSYVISEYVEFNNNNVCTTFGLEKRYAKSQFLSYEEAVEASIKYCLKHLI